MKQLVVLSGKGGTGKTVVAAAFVHLADRTSAGAGVAAVDADVDAANLELLVGGQRGEAHEFVGGVTARIDVERCSGCGDCEDVCRFEAVRPSGEWGYEVDPFACEGCGACYYKCPFEAVELLPRVSGSWHDSESHAGSPFLHARLRPAQENSGKLVTLIRDRARTAAAQAGCPLVIVDGPPGIACPAIAASTGADLALIVTEPTAAGLHDLRRILDMTGHFHLDRVVCINKHDLYPPGAAAIETECEDRGVEVLGSIPFDAAVPEAMAEGRAVTQLRPGSPAARAIEGLWGRIHERLLRGGDRRDLVTLSISPADTRSGNGAQ